MQNQNTKITVASYNICVDFFTNKDVTKPYHTNNRGKPLIDLLTRVNADVYCLQEISPEQGRDLAAALKPQSYSAMFLSQTPSDVDAGIIVDDTTEWIGKFMGTAIIGIFYKGELLEQGRFWFNEQPNVIPHLRDRSETDKGFGNMNTYRAVLWAKLLIGDRELFVFNSHYPLSGEAKTRAACARLEIAQIHEIINTRASGANPIWISGGDRNMIFAADKETYNVLTEENYYNDAENTWIGYDYDAFMNKVVDGEFASKSVLDLLISNCKPISCANYLGSFIGSELCEEQEKIVEGANFASDHTMIVMTI